MKNVTIKMPVLSWNAVLTVLNRFSVFGECRDIIGKIRGQVEKIEGEIKPDALLDIELSVDEFNIILIVVKSLPFYDSFDIVNAILTQGNTQIVEAKKEEEAAKPTEEKVE